MLAAMLKLMCRMQELTAVAKTARASGESLCVRLDHYLALQATQQLSLNALCRLSNS